MNLNLFRSLDSSTLSCGEETAGSFTRKRRYTEQPISKKEQDSNNEAAGHIHIHQAGVVAVFKGCATLHPVHWCFVSTWCDVTNISKVFDLEYFHYHQIYGYYTLKQSCIFTVGTRASPIFLYDVNIFTLLYNCHVSDSISTRHMECLLNYLTLFCWIIFWIGSWNCCWFDSPFY